MKSKFCAPLLGIAIMLASSAPAGPTSANEATATVKGPVNVIFDTDMMSDIDDALALAMLHALQDRHEANLIAITISTDDKWCASYVDLVDTFYGHPRIPIGIVRGGVNIRRSMPNELPPEPAYTQLLSERKNPDGSFVYPHRLIDGSQAPEAVGVLRRTLSAQPDQSVVMIQVGFSTNYARLLNSGPDSASPLNGLDLVRRKVRLLSMMAGSYAETHVLGKAYPKGQLEFNLMWDVPSAQRIFSAWPTPIVASGMEIGTQMLFPAFAIDHYYSYVPNHPIAEAYRAYAKWLGRKWPNDHHTCDLTSVLYAIRPDRNYFSLSKPGRITVLPGGGSLFDELGSGTHRHLILTEKEKARTQEAMVMLASQPPRRGRLDGSGCD